MPRIARVVIPSIPHHIIQRGNRGLQTFFNVSDYQNYKKLLYDWSQKEGIKILAYCLMTNHIHIIGIPDTVRSFERGIGEVHRRYACLVNFRSGWQGHLWQERFHSYPMDEAHLYEAVRYIELNPVKAKLVSSPEKYLWSSAPSRVSTKKDPLLASDRIFPIDNWRKYWQEGIDRLSAAEIESHARTGRPFGSDEFIQKLEILSGRSLTCQRRGRKPSPTTVTQKGIEYTVPN